MVFSGGHCALGPGRVMVMEQIAKHRKLSLAAKEMGMSYMKAWLLVRSLNRSFSKPVIELARGGKKGGGAQLTASGRKILALYRKMESQADKSLKADAGKIKRHLW